MLVKEAKLVAQQWVETEIANLPGYVGAFIFGSVNWMHDADPFPQTSDFDIRIVVDADELPGNYAKFNYKGLIIEASNSHFERVKSPEAVLSHYPTAAHFTCSCILSDPIGHLSYIQTVVEKEFARRKWVKARVEDAKNWQLSSLDRLDTSAPFHDQAFVWAYAASIFSHIILVADLKNPTVRKMQIAARHVLAQYDQLAFHERILELFGTVDMSREQVEHLFRNFGEVFEHAKDLGKTNTLTAMITHEAHSTMLGGIKEMIQDGYPREAAFWLLSMHMICQKILYDNTPFEIQSRFQPHFDYLMNSLGITSLEDVYQRIDQVKTLRPQVSVIADLIMDRNPYIFD